MTQGHSRKLTPLCNAVLLLLTLISVLTAHNAIAAKYALAPRVANGELILPTKGFVGDWVFSASCATNTDNALLQITTKRKKIQAKVTLIRDSQAVELHLRPNLSEDGTVLKLTAEKWGYRSPKVGFSTRVQFEPISFQAKLKADGLSFAGARIDREECNNFVAYKYKAFGKRDTLKAPVKLKSTFASLSLNFNGRSLQSTPNKGNFNTCLALYRFQATNNTVKVSYNKQYDLGPANDSRMLNTFGVTYDNWTGALAASYKQLFVNCRRILQRSGNSQAGELLAVSSNQDYIDTLTSGFGRTASEVKNSVYNMAAFLNNPKHGEGFGPWAENFHRIVSVRSANSYAQGLVNAISSVSPLERSRKHIKDALRLLETKHAVTIHLPEATRKSQIKRVKAFESEAIVAQLDYDLQHYHFNSNAGFQGLQSAFVKHHQMIVDAKFVNRPDLVQQTNLRYTKQIRENSRVVADEIIRSLSVRELEKVFRDDQSKEHYIKRFSNYAKRLSEVEFYFLPVDQSRIREESRANLSKVARPYVTTFADWLNDNIALNQSGARKADEVSRRYFDISLRRLNPIVQPVPLDQFSSALIQRTASIPTPPRSSAASGSKNRTAACAAIALVEVGCQTIGESLTDGQSRKKSIAVDVTCALGAKKLVAAITGNNLLGTSPQKEAMLAILNSGIEEVEMKSGNFGASRLFKLAQLVDCIL